jgi:environmental stress-induced protein Ves
MAKCSVLDHPHPGAFRADPPRKGEGNSVRILRSADYRRMPWKNGGGETTEIAVWPEGSGLDDFGWRVSMARVERDGPFSAFPGVDRTLAILEGEGLRLSVAGRAAVNLDAGAAPYSFPGDQPTDSSLLGGPITDLNVMTRRGQFAHTVRRIDVSGEAEIASEAETVLLLCHRGSASLRSNRRAERLGALDCLVAEGLPTAARIEAEQPASLFLIEIGKNG